MDVEVEISIVRAYLQSPACPSAMSPLHIASMSPAGVSLCSWTKHFRASPFSCWALRFGGSSVSYWILWSCKNKHSTCKYSDKNLYLTKWFCEKGKYQSTDNTKIGKERGKSYRKKWRDLRMKGTHKHPSGSYLKLSCGIIFTVCSHTFTLLWLRKTSVNVETYQLSFRVFMYAFHLKIT
jgi:hypothetical protein